MTIFTSALLSLALMFNAPDSAKLTETAEIPCKENYYGYEIDIGDIAETMVAEELNEYKTEFRDFINTAVNRESEVKNNPLTHDYEYLDLEDIDFNDQNKIAVHQICDTYNSLEYNADYDDFFEEVHSENKWRWSIIINNCAYTGMIYESKQYHFTPKYLWTSNVYGEGFMKAGNYVISIEKLIDNYKWSTDYILTNSRYLKHNIAYLLNKKNEACKDIDVIITDFGWGRTQCAVVFVENKAKYICTYGVTFILYDRYAVQMETPQNIIDTLSPVSHRLFNNKNYDSDDPEELLEDLYSYNMIIYYMKIVHEWNLL